MTTKHTFTGIHPVPSGLRVQFACGERGARRIEYVTVPWDGLDDVTVTKLFDRHVARKLIAYWSGVEPDPALF